MERVQDANENILEIFENDIDLYLRQFQEEQEIEDFKQVGQSVWNGALRYIYKHVFKNNRDLLKEHNNYTVNNNIIPNTMGIPIIVVPANHNTTTSIMLFFISFFNSVK